MWSHQKGLFAAQISALVIILKRLYKSLFSGLANPQCSSVPHRERIPFDAGRIFEVDDAGAGASDKVLSRQFLL